VDGTSKETQRQGDLLKGIYYEKETEEKRLPLALPEMQGCLWYLALAQTQDR